MLLCNMTESGYCVSVVNTIDVHFSPILIWAYCSGLPEGSVELWMVVLSQCNSSWLLYLYYGQMELDLMIWFNFVQCSPYIRHTACRYVHISSIRYLNTMMNAGPMLPYPYGCFIRAILSCNLKPVQFGLHPLSYAGDYLKLLKVSRSCLWLHQMF